MLAVTSTSTEKAFFNPSPVHGIVSLTELRRAMSVINLRGAAYLDYLLAGNYFDGKSVWVSECDMTHSAYMKLLDAHPHLVTESPYSAYFRRDGVRVRGENAIRLSSIKAAAAWERAMLDTHRAEVRAGRARPIAVFAGGPAAKIAALLCALQGQDAPLPVFFVDGAEQSNESGSASYEHINHANALSAEFDNSGLAIFMTAFRRGLLGEMDAEIALKPEYRRVDLWPKGIAFRDILIYMQYEIHGVIQRTMRRFGRMNEHDKSRLASKISSRVLSFLEERTGVRLRMQESTPRAFFLYMTRSQWQAAQEENRHLQKTLALEIRGLSHEALVQGYGVDVLETVCGGDVFPQNSCIRHGFDRLVADALSRLGGNYRARMRIREIYLAEHDAAGQAGPCAVAARVEDLSTGCMSFQPLDHLGLSLGSSATYHYHPDLAGGPLARWIGDCLKLGWPVPYQTIATGVTIQVLFRITDKQRYRSLPFTGMKQTHFVEIASDADHVLVKLTSGGNIGLPVYSRSYAISALANLLRIVTPNSGLTFVDVVCAWPCMRGINGANNGQIVRLGNNFAVRFGEGGTGMSKMGSNAQSILDLVGVHHGLPTEATLGHRDYRHTVLDRRARVLRRLRRNTA